MNAIISRGRDIVIFSLLLLLGVMSYGQDKPCATPDDLGLDIIPADIWSGSIDPDYLATFDPVVFNIKFWQVNEADGNNTNELSEELVLNAVANLNMAYNPYNIFFKYRGFGEIDSPAFVHVKVPDVNSTGEISCQYQYDDQGNPIEDPDGFGRIHSCQRFDLWSYAKDNNGYDPTAFNVYVPYGTDNFSGVSRGIYQTELIVPTGNLLKVTLIHEVGHNLGLIHTHRNFDETLCENVTRDPNNTEYFNALEAGDQVLDTAAAPNYIIEHCYFQDLDYSLCGTNQEFNREYVDEGECTYTGDNVDCDGFPYDIKDSDVQNYMSYSHKSCLDSFTVGQGIRMRELIAWDGQGVFQALMPPTGIAVLYEPYKGTYIDYAIQPNNDPPLFQPGFEYYFFECECECPEPIPWGDINFSYTDTNVLHILKDESDYSSITHPNHSAIAIKHPHEEFWPQPRRCFDNWETPPVIGGQITLFNDGVFNTNVTI
ncbi:MAG: hypothetical protein K0U54_09810, partial [Bacteroidetes bacterium]|nr:hypothetical protein [Bacteroidota bacterium]